MIEIEEVVVYGSVDRTLLKIRGHIRGQTYVRVLPLDSRELVHDGMYQAVTTALRGIDISPVTMMLMRSYICTFEEDS